MHNVLCIFQWWAWSLEGMVTVRYYARLPKIWVIPCTTRGCRFESGWGARFNSGTSDDQNLGEDEPHGRWRSGAATTAKTLKLSLHAACCHTLSRHLNFGDVHLTPTPSLASCQTRARIHDRMIDFCRMQLFAASTEPQLSSCTRCRAANPSSRSTVSAIS